MDTSKTLGTYNELMELTASIANKKKDIAFVEKHGHLPERKVVPTSEVDNKLSYPEVQVEIRRLNDLISKTQRKLKPSAKPSSHSKIVEWEEKLEMAISRREELRILKTQLENA